jgi:hypothetical protein
MEHMCTKQEVKEAVEEVLFDKDTNGDDLISRSVHAHITNKGNQIIASLTTRFIWAVLGLILSSAAVWYSLYYQVQRHEQLLGGTANYITREQQEMYARDIDRRLAEQNEKILQLREDFNTSIRELKGGIGRIENILLSQ